MGREVRRVPVDFDWPINKVWKGYLIVLDQMSAANPVRPIIVSKGQTHA